MSIAIVDMATPLRPQEGNGADDGEQYKVSTIGSLARSLWDQATAGDSRNNTFLMSLFFKVLD